MSANSAKKAKKWPNFGNIGHNVRPIDWKQSFDRFGDDLCELILNYLQISDKIRFECISRQFQRLIFNKQKCLRVSLIRSSDTINELLDKRIQTRYQSMNLSAFESVLKKFKFLQTIRIEGRIAVDSELIKTIADNCHKLQELSITVRYIGDISSVCIDRLGRNCGQTLRTIKFDGLNDKQLKQLFALTPNVQSIAVENIRTILAVESSGQSSRTRSQSLSGEQSAPERQPLLSKLKEIQFYRCNEKLLNQMQSQYSGQLTKIMTHLLTLDFGSDESLNRSLSGFGVFQRLQSLDICVDVCDASDVLSIETGLRHLAEDCRHLKQLSFTLDGNLLQNNLMETFGRFEALSSLEIFITTDPDLGDYSYKYGSVESMRRMKQLKTLSLNLEQLSDENLKQIDRYLPQLVSVRLNSGKVIADKTLHFLSNLKFMTKLEIITFTTEDTDNITDAGVRQLIQKCPRIQSLSLDQKNPNFDFLITHSSIESIIERSQRMPKIQYNFSFAINTKNENNIDFNQTNDLPHNLSIEIL